MRRLSDLVGARIRKDAHVVETLTPDVLPAFRTRFDGFHDALIRSINIEQTGGESRITVTVVLDAQDGNADWKWIRVSLTIHDAADFVITEGPGYYMVIFELDVDCNDDGVQISQNPEAWFIRGKRLTWSEAPVE
jgi:hypothetical protein